MADVTLNATPQEDTLRPDGYTETGAYRVGRTIDGQHVYAFCEKLASPIDAQFVQIRHSVRYRKEQCCVCNVVFASGDMLTTVISSNHTMLFPTCFVHTACVPLGGYGMLIDWLRHEWRNAQRYACWF